MKLASGAADVGIFWSEAAAAEAPGDRGPRVRAAPPQHGRLGSTSGPAGFVAAVPDLPAWSDHARNGRFITDLCAYLCAGEPWRQRIDPARVGLMGFSTSGSPALLASTAQPGPAIWVGLDPVDHKGMGAKAAPLVRCRGRRADRRTLGLQRPRTRATSSWPCRAANTSASPGQSTWTPSGPLTGSAEVVCGRSTDDRRIEFRQRATAALREALAVPPTSVSQGGL